MGLAEQQEQILEQSSYEKQKESTKFLNTDSVSNEPSNTKTRITKNAAELPKSSFGQKKESVNSSIIEPVSKQPYSKQTALTERSVESTLLTLCVYDKRAEKHYNINVPTKEYLKAISGKEIFKFILNY